VDCWLVWMVWNKRLWCCPNDGCAKRSWTENVPRIAAARLTLTDRAGRWGRTVNELAVELGCDWHTVNNAVIAYGAPLIDDPARIGLVVALGIATNFFEVAPSLAAG